MAKVTSKAVEIEPAKPAVVETKVILELTVEEATLIRGLCGTVGGRECKQRDMAQRLYHELSDVSLKRPVAGLTSQCTHDAYVPMDRDGFPCVLQYRGNHG